jgi:hypothetical protein
VVGEKKIGVVANEHMGVKLDNARFRISSTSTSVDDYLAAADHYPTLN